MKKLIVPAVAVLGALLSGCGSGASTSTSSSGGTGSSTDIAIEMRDIAYSPTALAVKKGDSVKLTFTNKGAIVHEALVGDESAQMAHAEEMSSMGSGSSSSMGGMDHGSSSDMVTVDPGASATLTHTFDKTGTVIIGCHEPGHYEAGMKITVTVS